MEALLRLGDLNQERGQWEQALANYDQVLTLEPENCHCFFQVHTLGLVLCPVRLC